MTPTAAGSMPKSLTITINITSSAPACRIIWISFGPVSLNPDSLEELASCRLEPCLESAEEGTGYQFERLGYFCIDAEDSRPGAPVFNRTVNLRDTWGKIQKSQKK